MDGWLDGWMNGRPLLFTSSVLEFAHFSVWMMEGSQRKKYRDTRLFVSFFFLAVCSRQTDPCIVESDDNLSIDSDLLGPYDEAALAVSLICYTRA